MMSVSDVEGMYYDTHSGVHTLTHLYALNTQKLKFVSINALISAVQQLHTQLIRDQDNIIDTVKQTKIFDYAPDSVTFNRNESMTVLTQTSLTGARVCEFMGQMYVNGTHLDSVSQLVDALLSMNVEYVEQKKRTDENQLKDKKTVIHMLVNDVPNVCTDRLREKIVNGKKMMMMMTMMM